MHPCKHSSCLNIVAVVVSCQGQDDPAQNMHVQHQDPLATLRAGMHIFNSMGGMSRQTSCEVLGRSCKVAHCR